MILRCSLCLLLLRVARAQDEVKIGAPADFSVDFPFVPTESSVMNVIRGTFLLDAELGLETNFEDIDRVVKGTIGSICQYSPVLNAPVVVQRFLDMDSLVLRRKTFRFEWSLLPLQSHPLPGNCMSTLSQMSFGPSAPPYQEIGKSPPAIRRVFAMELGSYSATRALDSTYWGLTLRNVSCLPGEVTRAILDDGPTETTTTVLPTHVCDGRKYATGDGEETGFDPTMVSDCSMAKEDPCLCASLTDCEWQPGSGNIPGGCASTKNPGVTCEACPFQPKCAEPDQSIVCAQRLNACDCAFTKATRFGYGCVFNGACVARSTPDSAATSCDDCPTQIRCGTPRVEKIRPVEGAMLGEQGIWSLELEFDRVVEIGLDATSDESGVQLRCDVWEESGGQTYRVSKWMLSTVESTFRVDLTALANDYRRTCFVTMANNVIRSAQSGLPFGGMELGEYFLYLPDTSEPQIDAFDPPNSVRGLGVDIQVTLTFTEPIARGRATEARRVEVYRSGDATNGALLAAFSFSDQQVTMQPYGLTVDLTGLLEPNSFYSIAIPPSSLNDLSGNNFTGLPRNVYIFGTAIESTRSETNWTDTLWMTIGVILVVLLVFIGGAVAYLIINSGTRNARVFARAVRRNTKKVSQVAPIIVEDLDNSDNFYHQTPATAANAADVVAGHGGHIPADATPIESFRASSKVAVAWDWEGGKTPKLNQGADPAILRSGSKVSALGVAAPAPIAVKLPERRGPGLERGISKNSLQATALVAAPVAEDSPPPPAMSPTGALVGTLPRGSSKISLAWEGPKSLGSSLPLPNTGPQLLRASSKLTVPGKSPKKGPAERNSSLERSSGRELSLSRGGSKMSVISVGGREHSASPRAAKLSVQPAGYGREGHEPHVSRSFSKMSVQSTGPVDMKEIPSVARSPRPTPSKNPTGSRVSAR